MATNLHLWNTCNKIEFNISGVMSHPFRKITWEFQKNTIEGEIYGIIGVELVHDNRLFFSHRTLTEFFVLTHSPNYLTELGNLLNTPFNGTFEEWIQSENALPYSGLHVMFEPRRGIIASASSLDYLMTLVPEGRSVNIGLVPKWN